MQLRNGYKTVVNRKDMKSQKKYLDVLCFLVICFSITLFTFIEAKAQEISRKENVSINCDEELFSISPKAALISAISNDETKCVKIFLQKGLNPNFKINNEYGTFPILVALVKGSAEIIKELVKAGADVKGNEGKDALMIASSEGYLDIIKIFLEAGADVNGKVNGKITPLMAAAYHNQQSVVELLLKCNADANTVSDEGISSLMLVDNNEQIVELLIKAGALIDATDNQGQTALFYAVKNSQYKKIEVLIKNGANVNWKDKKGLASLDLAEKIEDLKQREKIIKILNNFKEN